MLASYKHLTLHWLPMNEPICVRFAYIRMYKDYSSKNYMHTLQTLQIKITYSARMHLFVCTWCLIAYSII